MYVSKISFYMHILTFLTHGLLYYCRVIFALLLFVAQRSPVAQHLAGRGVMVVFVFRYQSCRIRVRHHQVVFIAEAAFDVAVAADDADQVTAAIVFVANQRTADPDRFTEDGQTLQQRHRQQPHFGRLLVRAFC